MIKLANHSQNLWVQLIIAGSLFCLIFLFYWVDRQPLRSFLNQEEFLDIVKSNRSTEFFRALAQRLGKPKLGHKEIRGALLYLNSLGKKGNYENFERLEAVRATILVQHGYLQRGLQILNGILPTVKEPEEREALQIIKAETEQKLGLLKELTSTVATLKNSGYDVSRIEEFLRSNARIIVLEPTWAAIVWIILLIMPLAVVELDRRLWIKRFIDGANNNRLFHAFRTSPITAFECVISAILVMMLKLPWSLGLSSSGITPILLHLVCAYLLCLVPNYLLDKTIRKTAWTLFSYIMAMIRLNFIQLQLVIVPLLGGIVLRQMALHLTMWPLFAPLGVCLGFAAITGFLNLVISFTVPILMGFSKWNYSERPEWIKRFEFNLYKWDLRGSGIHNAFAFGNFSLNQGVAITTPLLEKFSPEDTLAILAHEEGHLRLGHLFQHFLAQFNIMLFLGLFAIYSPLGIQKMLLFGPSLVQWIALFAGYLVFNLFYRSLQRALEREADVYAMIKVGEREYIQALSRLNALNFIPTHWRKGEGSFMTHPSLDERRRYLRELRGEFFEPRAIPSNNLLVSLWRSRLALDWSFGSEHAIQLCSLDLNLSGFSEEEQFRELAKRQCEFGGECLYILNKQRLEVIACTQKSAARFVDPPLPVDRICFLCSSGMQMAISQKTNWISTQQGCIIERKELESGKELTEAPK